MDDTVSQSANVPFWVSACGNAAPLASIVVFMAPMPTIQQITRDKTVGALPLLPYSSMVASCILWISYGMMKGESKIWGTNLVGLVFGIFYFQKFTKWAPPKSKTLPGSIENHLLAIAGIILATLLLMYASPVVNPTNVIGNIAVVFCMIMFASPLAALKTVIRDRSARSIPLPFTIATIINCFLWSVFGLLEVHDVNVYFPNLIGLAFGLAQVVLKLLFGNGAQSVSESKLDTLL